MSPGTGEHGSTSVAVATRSRPLQVGSAPTGTELAGTGTPETAVGSARPAPRLVAGAAEQTVTAVPPAPIPSHGALRSTASAVASVTDRAGTAVTGTVSGAFAGTVADGVAGGVVDTLPVRAAVASSPLTAALSPDHGTGIAAASSPSNVAGSAAVIEHAGIAPAVPAPHAVPGAGQRWPVRQRPGQWPGGWPVTPGKPGMPRSPLPVQVAVADAVGTAAGAGSGHAAVGVLGSDVRPGGSACTGAGWRRVWSVWWWRGAPPVTPD